MNNATEAIDNRALLKRAVLKLNELQSKLDWLSEPIAVVGLGCRFPGKANDPDTFWQLLRDGVDGITEIPSDRWKVEEFYDPTPSTPGKMYARRGGFIEGVDQFDPHFFGISPREALKMDPQQRLLLEVTWEALERAGQAPPELIGSRAGVYIGMGGCDYGSMQTSPGDFRAVDTYFASGVSQSMASGRLSYLLGLQGPSVSLDTACSSSLYAVHLACQSLRLAECDIAIAGGVNLILSPGANVATCQARMLSPEGRCKTFDASADGYVRAEGCAVVVLKRLSDAQTNGDNILALIRGTAANQDGRSNGLTAPNGAAQEAVICEALAKSQVSPSAVSYVEVHGTGTSLGDPIEVQALGSVFKEGRSGDTPLLLGAVKTNIGHCEAAAGIAGLVKVILALQHNLLPPTLHVQQLNPLIPWETLPVQVVTHATHWQPINGKRIAGVSAFGFSGTNVHAVVEEAPAPVLPVEGVDRPLHIFNLSAKTETALKSLAGDFARHLAADSDARIADVCFTANTGRSHFNHRLAASVFSGEELREKLSAFSNGAVVNGMQSGRVDTTRRPEVVFLFTGQGSQYVGMGRQLYETQSTFRTTLERCDSVLGSYLEQPLLSLLYSNAANDLRLNETRYTQPALFAIEYALAELWTSWGIVPSAVMGHSVGEYVAACVAGVLSLEDALKLIAERGRLMQGLAKNGKMAVVFAGHETAISAISPHVDLVAIAALNGPENTVISGDGEAVEKILARLEQEGIKAKPLAASHAFHSPLMAPMLDEFDRIAGTIAYSPPRIELISNLTGRLFQPADVIDGQYWRRHVREPVQFAAGMETLHQQGYKIFVEIGPDSTLLAMGRRCVTNTGTVWLPSLRHGRDNWQQVLETLGALYIQGVEVDWRKFDRSYSRRRAALPVYPFERERYWAKMADMSPRVSLSQPAENGIAIHPLLGRRLPSALKEIQFENQISLRSHPLLRDHRFFGTAVFPATAYLEMARAAAAQAFEWTTCTVENLNVHEALLIAESDPITTQFIVTPENAGAASFELLSLSGEGRSNRRSSWKLHASGKISIGTSSAQADRVSREDILARCQNQISMETYYQMCTDRGVDYGPSFQRVDALWEQDGEAIGHIQLAASQAVEAANYGMHPALFDACFQVLGATLKGDLYMPIVVNRARVYECGERNVWCHAQLTEGNERGAEIVVGDFRLFNDSGDLVADVRGLHFKRVQRDFLLGPAEKQSDSWLYEVAWLPVGSTDLKSPPTTTGGWIILADDGGVGAKLAERLQERGDKCTLVFPGAVLEHLSCGNWRVDPTRPQDFKRLLREITAGTSAECLGVIHLWSVGYAVSEKSTLSEIHEYERMTCGTALHLVQALANSTESRMPGLWLVTRGAQPVENGESPAIVQASLWGLGAAISIEHPTLRCVRVDLGLGFNPIDGDAQALFAEILSNDREDQVALRHGHRYAARLGRCGPTKGANKLPGNIAKPWAQRLEISKRGSLENLSLVPMTRRAPNRGEVEIRVLASGLNFRDVLNALDMYPGDAGRLGNECVGKVVSMGEGVEGLKIGDEVVAVASDCFATYVTTNADFVLPKPGCLSPEEAATIPITFLTAHYALNHLAAMSEGDRVLIHSGAGGVGMAAVQLAQRVGAEIFATAGSPEKREFLKSLGVQHVMNSRSLTFADEVMQATNGAGIDIVLNSLTGDAIPKSLNVLRAGGRFLEIGKSGIWDEGEVSRLRPDIAYHIIFLGQTLQDEPTLSRVLFNSLLEDFNKGDLKPLPFRAFGLENSRDAFRHMARAKHIGKIVIVQPADDTDRVAISAAGPVVSSKASYLVTGGLGALGLQVAKWLVSRGARNIVLAGRRDPSPDAQEVIEELERLGARVHVARCDVSRQEQVRAILDDLVKLSMPPLRGVMHSAGVLDDDLLLNLTWERFAKVMAPKIDGSWILHQLTQDLHVDFFVLFSSLAAVFGSAGQGNYSAANAFLDALAHHRRARGLPALSINWGAWGETGMAANLGSSGEKRMARLGIDSIDPELGTEAMEQLLHGAHTQVSVVPIHWQKFLDQIPGAEVPRFFSGIAQVELLNRGPDNRKQSVAARQGLKRVLSRSDLVAADPSDRPNLLTSYLKDQLARLMGIAQERLELHEPLINLGFDSLMAVELKSRIEADMGVVVSVGNLLQGYSMAQIGAQIIEQIAVVVPPPASQSPMAVTTGDSDWEVVKL